MIDSLPGERWLPVPGYEGLYLVSDHGRVYALERTRQCGHPGSAPQVRPAQLLKPNPVGTKRTHLAVTLQRDKRRWHVKVHQLVLLAFVGPCPEGMEVLHWDDNPRNNHLSNLRYGTRQENIEDAKRNGRTGRKTHCVHGHELTPENTYVWRGSRSCKSCMRRRTRERRQRIAVQNNTGKVA